MTPARLRAKTRSVNKTLGKAVIERRKNRQDDSLDQYEMLAKFEKGLAEIETRAAK